MFRDLMLVNLDAYLGMVFYFCTLEADAVRQSSETQCRMYLVPFSDLRLLDASLLNLTKTTFLISRGI